MASVRSVDKCIFYIDSLFVVAVVKGLCCKVAVIWQESHPPML